jgi:threonine synthase
VKIIGRCRNCGRDFPIDVVTAEPKLAGRCPFCGKPLDIQYAPVLVEALRQLQAAGTLIEAVLERAISLGTNLEIEEDSVLEPMTAALRARARASAERKATEEAAKSEPALPA